VKAVEGDQRITLYWDNKAENSFDAFYQRINFEGYRVYRSTEPNFLEDKIITDANGQPIFRKPIAQFDLVDGVTGLHPIDVAGAKFYLGDDSGLKHSFTDTTVQNGQTYYYAVVSYDKGFTDTSVAGVFQGIPPSETTSIIKLVNGKYKTDINTVVVTPHAPSAGYIAPDLLNKMHIGSGTGTIEVSMIDPDSLRKSHSYKIEFADTSLYHNNTHPTYTLVDLTSNDTLIKKTSMKGLEEQTNVIHGFTVKMTNDTIVSVDRNVKKTAWAIVDSTFVVTTGFDKTNSAALSPRRVDYPADFEITFTEPGKGDTLFPSSTFPPPPFATNIKIKNLTENIDHWQFVFFDQNKDSLFNAGDAIYLVVGDSAGRPATDFGSAHFSWSMSLFKDTTRKFDQKITPNPGEVYRIVTKKPFRAGETFTFTSKAPGFDQNQAKNDLNRISVVPNPYVGAASWEQQSDAVGRGERKIYFTHLPAKCTIRIYTISGKLVQQFNHDSSISDGQESWNLVSRDGMDIAYGVYIYHVDAPGIGTKINRFAIIK
ncbi:MAG: hypothetical protein Q8903_12695, partial [Bacteroidota bacterium]|nr:hypothetical protein [Bacteroidota bacterium]